MLKKLIWIGFSCGAAGLLGLAAAAMAGAGGPAVLHQIVTPVSMLLLFVAVPALVLAWLLTICKEVKAKNYPIAALWAILGMVVILRQLYRIL